MRINHAERVRRNGAALKNCNGAEFYAALLGQAAGSAEVERKLGDGVAKLQGFGVPEGDAMAILLVAGEAMRENGFNAGFDAGFSEAAILGTFGKAQ